MKSPILSALLDLTSVRLLPDTDLETCFIPLRDGLGVWYMDPGSPLCVINHVTPPTASTGMPSEEARKILLTFGINAGPLDLPDPDASFVSLSMRGDPAGLPERFALRCSHGERSLLTGEVIKTPSQAYGQAREVIHSGQSLMDFVQDVLGVPQRVNGGIHMWPVPQIMAI